MKGLFLLPILLFSCTSGDGQYKKTDYKIDKSIVAEVAENTRKEGKLDIGSLEIRYYENDSLVSETFGNDKSIPFMIMQQHSDSVIFIDGIVGMFDASGFQLHITKKTYNVRYFSNSDFKIFKKQQTDTVLNTGINLKCKSSSLTLATYPKFENDEEITGIVTFETPEYWQVLNGTEKKIRLEGKAYFATKLTN